MGRVYALLAKSRFLGRLPKPVLEALVAKGHVRKVPRGSAVYQRGDAGDSLMALLDGKVKLTNTSLGGKEILLYYIVVGEAFGEVAALDGGERAADAVAVEDSEVFVICTRDLLPTLSEHPPALLEIIKELCGKLRLGAQVIEDNTLELLSRTARGLHRLARQIAKPTAEGICVTIAQEELGRHLDMSRTAVNRYLSELKAADVILVDGMDITIIDEDRLTAIAQARAAK